ncbi:hypothetical protein SDRG_04918 [Saprolegnia diclina VS20]|uniref:Uncharacterized protein n=1 Tax=Saprolegnia diclina (strain VS20) TaxID=1156394 RepID=T0QV51_SAPDV|nr:hypothetical protein SDRG_04918 [Saprolegnia diclina VS20]EQC37900.1 hypothetical protein SDRG_04918 [Saprolegnia diclina VS20]|eukprot:XP_008608833.1 hypothetical protein SDRG_04918 [Saprolegnia diclina VS20]
MGQGASLVKTIVADSRELVRMTNKDAYMAQYKAYAEATAKLDAAKKQNALLQEQLEKTKNHAYAQSEAFQRQKLEMDKQIDKFVSLHSIGHDVRERHEQILDQIKKTTK